MLKASPDAARASRFFIRASVAVLMSGTICRRMQPLMTDDIKCQTDTFDFNGTNSTRLLLTSFILEALNAGVRMLLTLFQRSFFNISRQSLIGLLMKRRLFTKSEQTTHTHYYLIIHGHIKKKKTHKQVTHHSVRETAELSDHHLSQHVGVGHHHHWFAAQIVAEKKSSRIMSTKSKTSLRVRK